MAKSLKPTNSGNIAAILSRTSSGSQLERSAHYTTAEAQVDACTARAREDGFEAIIEYDDVESGRKHANHKRQGLSQMVADAKNGKFFALYVTELSRISRDVITLMETLETLDSCGVKVVALRDPDADQSPTGKFMRVLKAGLNALETDTISARVRAKAQEKAIKGLNNGGIAPFGYQSGDPGCPRILDSKRAPFIRVIFEQSANGYSPHEIATELNKSDLSRVINKKFRGDQIKSWITNPYYKGEYPAGQKGAHNGIVTEDLWQAAQPKDLKKTMQPTA